MSMQSYVIRIYRYKENRPDKLVGTIEGEGYDVPASFTNIEELWSALNNNHTILTDSESVSE